LHWENVFRELLLNTGAKTMSIKLRGIIIADIEVSSLAEANWFDELLKEYGEKIKAHFDPNWSVARGDDIQLDKIQTEVPMQERRGETGPISEIVFRGSRGANSPIRIPNNVSAGVKKRLQFARNTMIKKGMGTEDIQDQIDREAEHLMKQYNEGRKYIHYSGDMESIFDND
jgi:hypothetical protein